MSRNNNTRLVYSTDTGGKCPACGWPQRNCQCSTSTSGRAPLPERLTVKLRLEKSGRGGKTVTVVFGLPDNEAFLKELRQKLMRACGVGGTVGDATVELQGDVRDRVRSVLQALGYTVRG